MVALVASLSGCEDKKKECAVQPNTSSIKIEVQLVSLEDSLYTFTNKQQLVDFFSRHHALRDVFFNRPGYPNDSTFINEVYRRFQSPAMDTLRQETKAIFGDGSALKEEFTKAFTNIKFYYPQFQIPTIETVITGFESDLFLSDTLIIVGLDYFLGSRAKYRPYMHEYMLKRYTKEFVVPSTMLLYGIDSRINKIDPTDKSVLADMIAYGKAYYFAKRMVPCVPDSVLIGYSSAEISSANVNKDMIWKHLVEKEVFYNTMKSVKQKYIEERPKTIEIGDQCPGRIGVWIGWQIIDEYARRNSTGNNLSTLMQLDNAQQIFVASKFRPN